MARNGGDELTQCVSRPLRRTRPSGIGRVAENTDETIFSDWTGSPASRGMLMKPANRTIVVFVVGILPSNQHIDIKQPNWH